MTDPALAALTEAWKAMLEQEPVTPGVTVILPSDEDIRRRCAAILAHPAMARWVARSDQPPADTRLVLMAADLFDVIALRTENGRALTVEWGEPSSEGWYTPTFTATEDDWYKERADLARKAAAWDRFIVEWNKLARSWTDDYGYVSADAADAAIAAALEQGE